MRVLILIIVGIALANLIFNYKEGKNGWPVWHFWVSMFITLTGLIYAIYTNSN